MEYKDGGLTSNIIAAAIEVHKALGNGFPEVIYQRALEAEFEDRKLTAIREHEMPIYYKGRTIGNRRVDFLFNNKICIELKAVTALTDVHLAQVLNYLEALNMEIGLLLNFGARSLEIKRLHNKKYSPLVNFNPNRPL
jgi:GxxExxY protein